MKHPTRPAITAVLIFLAAAAGSVHAQADTGAEITRPPGYKPQVGDVKLGEKLFNDTRLSSNGMSCASCHAGLKSYSASFAKPYPHTVAMARDQLGRKQVHLDEMVQACMVMPMAAKPLPWNSRELAALAAFEQQQQKSFESVKP